jgi:hypothetical protein
MVTAVTLFARRCLWYVRALGFNPLVRASDRLEALAVLAVVVTAFVVLPVAAQAGEQIYDAGVRNANEQARSRHSVEAVVVEGSAGLPIDFDSPDYVRAQWREGTHLRTEQVISPATVKVGEPLKLWLDNSGKVVAAPTTVEDARISAVSAAGMVWVTIVACSTAAALVIRRRLDRFRARAWERELRLMAHNDDGWANRHI